MRSLVAAIRFLTRLSIPGKPTEARDLPHAIAWFPLIAFLPSISPGLGKDLQAARSPQAFVVANFLVIAVTVLAWYLDLKHLYVGVAAAIACTAFWAIYLRRRLGGHTGDLLGAGNQLVEAIVLLAICARTD